MRDRTSALLEKGLEASERCPQVMMLNYFCLAMILSTILL
jgi:hypothetical protein